MMASKTDVAKTIVYLLCFTITVLALIVTMRTLLIQHHHPLKPCTYGTVNETSGNDWLSWYLNLQDPPEQDHAAINSSQEVFQRFRKALTFKTITKAPKNYSVPETLEFVRFIEQSFPTIHSSPLVHRQVISGLSLLYTVKGSNPKLKPYILLAHMDVVPVQESMWSVPPFGGVDRDEYIWGRGALDLKSVVMGQLEALEHLLRTGTPIERSFYLAIGHDEEGRGLDGAAQISKYMISKGWDDVEFILDEGPYIFRNALPGVERDVAMIGVAEKGLVNIRLSTNGTVGHSSMPPKETAIVKMSRAVSKLHANSHRNQFGQGPERDMVEALAPYCSIWYRLLYTNLWLFQPLVAKLLEANKMMNSFIRTTTAVTVFSSGIKDNVLPSRAEVTVNHRVYPLNTVAQTLERDIELIDDPEVDVRVLGVAIEPHPISPYGPDSFGYTTIHNSIEQTFPRVAIIPGIMYAATDTRWFLNFTANIYRFSPGYITPQTMNIVHGHDERISKDNYLRLINFYHHVMLNGNRVRVDDDQVEKDEF